MLVRCPGAIPVRTYELLGWKLLFRRTADIVPCFGHTVIGGLYRITEADSWALDRYEGIRRGRYRRKHFLVGGQWVLSYVMDSSISEEAPSAEYLALIDQGYQDWHLPTAGLALTSAHALGVDSLVGGTEGAEPHPS